MLQQLGHYRLNSGLVTCSNLVQIQARYLRANEPASRRTCQLLCADMMSPSLLQRRTNGALSISALTTTSSDTPE